MSLFCLKDCFLSSSYNVVKDNLSRKKIRLHQRNRFIFIKIKYFIYFNHMRHDTSTSNVPILF